VAAQRLRLVLATAFLAASLGAHAAGEAGKDLKIPQRPWKSLPVESREVLAPLAADWDKMPGYQQSRLLSAARQYPKLRPIQQERFHERIRDWATMSPDQRKAARDSYQGMQKLPPAKQHELRERWLERKGNPEVGSPGKPR
jgi:Protein of unknown function (DUF3106)